MFSRRRRVGKEGKKGVGFFCGFRSRLREFEYLFFVFRVNRRIKRVNGSKFLR